MSIKDFFKEKRNVKTIQDLNKETLGKEVESINYLDVHNEIQKRYIPPVDLSRPENFVKFGSAESYYTDSIERIYNTYPYDGSLFEKLEWEHSSSFLDLYIFKNEYPRTTGYALFSPSGWGSLDGSKINDFGLSDNPEYIQFKGGPHAGEIDYAPYTNANIYDASKNRKSNLILDFDQGVSIEFWLKKAAFIDSAKTTYETVFDVWNGETSSEGYGRFFFVIKNNGRFVATINSGSVSNSLNLTLSADDKWHHYAFSARNEGSALDLKFYKDGAYIVTETGTKINEITGSLIANIGAARIPARTQAQAIDLSDAQKSDGYGKLSGSIDEFRFWKNERTAKQIGTYWIDQVGGGTNTDDANTDLGVYYKFNEGIVETGSLDSVVLDYSGRVSNGRWTGYSPLSRATGSAIVESSASLREFKDPIIRSNHPKVISYKEKKVTEGREYDFRNSAAIINSIPTWIVERDEENENFTLKKLTQIIASYFDSLSLQMDTLSTLKDIDYLSGSFTPSPFINRTLESAGLSIQTDLFDLASALEYYKARGEKKIFEKKIQDVKNLIYQNVYNNLVYIYKSKGTEKAFRNMIRCFGLGEEVYKLNIYSNDETFNFRDNYFSTTETKKYINFNTSDNSDAVVYQYKDESNANATSFVDGTNQTDGTKEGAGYSITVESEILFPKKVLRDSVAFGSQFDTQTGSLFGMHNALTSSSDEKNLTWSGNDYANFQVYSVRTVNPVTGDLTKNAYFFLTCSALGRGGSIPKLKSPKFYEVYDNKEWNFAVRIKPQENPFQTAVSGSTDGTATRKYDVEFYGVNSSLDIVDNEFVTSGTMTYDEGVEFLSSPKRLYAGAHRQNFTGSVLTYSDIKLGSLRFWNTYLPNTTIKQHAFDSKNYGVENPIKNAFLQQETLSAREFPEIKTLALNWDFNLITGSNASGRFLIEDFSSGSAKGLYGWVGDITDKQHTGRADFFNNTDKKVYSTEYILSAKKQLPELIYSSDTVKIVSQVDEKFTRDTRPSHSTFIIEKSMYRTISEEMLNMFSSITAFNNLIGEPADKYRQKYKKLEKLRQLFFERVNNTPDVEKYVDYYKWIDNALSEMLKKLVPISADFPDDPSQTIIESHILERNKYHHKFPTLEFKGTDPEAHIKGINELGYDWKYGHAPIPFPDEIAEVDNLLSTAGSPSNNDRFTVNVPAAAGGTGVAITIRIVFGTPSAGTTNEIQVQVGGNNNSTADRLRAAINGDSNTTIYQYGAGSGDSTNGLAGITAAVGGSGLPNVKITADQAGAPGNSITFTDVQGDVVEDGSTGASPATLTGGTDKQAEYENCLWWKDRADRKGVLSSRNTNIDNNKEKILSAHTTVDVSGSTYAVRKFTKPYRFSTGIERDFRGGINFSKNKKIDYWRITRGQADLKIPTTGQQEYITTNVGDIEKWNLTSSCADDSVLINKKKMSWKFSDQGPGLDDEGVYGKLASFFNIYSSSVNNNPGTFQTHQHGGLEIVNLHHDLYGPDKEKPLQGPFTEKYVGGLQYRHADLNVGARDSSQTRAEGWRIKNLHTLDAFNIFGPDQDEGGVLTTALPRAIYIREEYAKRPVNIRNIQMTTGSASLASGDSPQNTGISPTKIGNYTHPYEVVQTSGRKINNRWFAKNEGIDRATNVRSYQVSGAYERLLPTRTKNKTVFAERFSAPGGPEINGRGFLDMESEEYSVYNSLPWRNLTVKEPLQDLLTKRSGKFGVDSETGDTSKGRFTDAAFHKINKNRRKRFEVSGNVKKHSDVDGVDGYDHAHTASAYDNWYVQHPIPQSDMQYTWITASVINDPTRAVLGYQQPNYKRADLASDDLIFVSASDHVSYLTSGLVFFGASRQALEAQATRHIVEAIDFAGMNNNIVEPIDSVGTNILGNSEMTYVAGNNYRGTSNYINHDLVDYVLEDVPPGNAFDRGRGVILNGIILHRQGPYGWPIWKQIRTGNHPIARKHKRENTISFVHASKNYALGEELTSYAEPVVSSKFFPMVHNIKFKEGEEITEGTNIPIPIYKDVNLKHTYSNNLVKFTKRIAAKDKTTLNDMFGQGINSNLPSPNTSMYEKINYFLEVDATTTPLVNPLKELNFINYKETVFPREQYTFSSKVRGRDSYTCPFWREKKRDRNTRKTENSQHWRVTNQSMWPLDERKNWMTSAPLVNLDNISRAGELQNNYTIYHSASSSPGTKVTGACLLDYPRWDNLDWGTRTSEAGGTRRHWGYTKFISDQKWEAAEQAGKEPFAINYEVFAENMRRVAKDFSVVPEFRISDHMPFYINEKGGNFNAEKSSALEDFLGLSGSSNEVSTYSHSDFMKHFGEIKERYDDKGMVEKRLTLTMDAAMKLLPYDGFYPATRTVQLATLFQDCYGSNIKYNIETTGGHENIRTILQPFFAPGILYNTIKSGIAVDWPLLDGGRTTNTPLTLRGSNDQHRPRYSLSGSEGTWYSGGENTYQRKPRIPFEGLVEPENAYPFLSGIRDCNPHPSASLDCIASWDGQSESPLYKLAMHNFLAETIDFFLADGNLQAFSSKPDTSPNHFIVEDGMTMYMMDLICYRKTTFGKGQSLEDDPFAALFTSIRPVNKNYSTLEMCDNWASFGPPVDQRTPGVVADSRDPYTPPYYHGLSRARLKFIPRKGPGKYTLPEIMEDTKINFKRVLGISNYSGDPAECNDSLIAAPALIGLYNYAWNSVNPKKDLNLATLKYSTSAAEAMNLDSCMNLRSLTNVKSVDFKVSAVSGRPAIPVLIKDDPNAGSAWVIQTKFETPVLNFKNKSSLTPAYGTGSIVNGIWHQYGDIPDIDGIFLELRDPVQNFAFGDKREGGVDIIGISNDNKPPDEWKYDNESTGSTGSLGKLCGFKLGTPQKIGQIAPTKKISEAVIAIPYIAAGQNKAFFNIPSHVISNAKALIDDPSLNFLGEEGGLSTHPDEAIIDMVEKMQRFVLPPKIDFLTNKSISSFSMYIFEFTHELSQKDLADIWQNLPPDDKVGQKRGGTQIGIGLDFKMQRQTITHELVEYKGGAGWFVATPSSGIKVPLANTFPENTKWILFKVKQKANWNYFTKTADSRDDSRFKFNFELGSKDAEKESVPDYSYNWPYDYFSLVELIKMKASVEFNKDD